MSATLTWAKSGNGTKTGTAVANFFDDLDTLVTSKAADATFLWEKAGKNSASTPYYLNLRRKDASAGRISLICWTSTPAANNVAILDQTPVLSQVFIAWFPAGTGTTLSNLTAASGTINGNDTGCVKVCATGTIAGYSANVVPFYADSAEGMFFGWANPASSATSFFCGAGDLLINSADAVSGCTFGGGSAVLSNFGSTSGWLPWLSSTLNAGASNACFRTNYGSANRVYFQGWSPSGSWASVAVSSTDILTNTATNDVWFPSMQLLGQTKGEGFIFKLRQICFGPGTVGPFTPYNLTGPVETAWQFCNATTGGLGFPWMVNFKN